MFASLPPEVRNRFATAAANRLSTNGDLFDLNTMLQTLAHNFDRLRYPFERCERKIEQDCINAERRWLELGALDVEVDVAYYPEGCSL